MVWSGFLSSASLVSVSFFSFCLLTSNNLSFFWLFMELCTLSLVPGFFWGRGRYGLVGLFNYLVVSSISSSFILVGVLFESFSFLTVLGFFVKFGVFPFFGWVFSVLLTTNLFIVWSFSTILKIPFFYFPFFLCSAGFSGGSVSPFFVLSFLFLGCFFWVYNYALLYSWITMMLASSVVLVVCSFTISLDSLFYLYLVYFVWSSLVVSYIFWFFSPAEGGVGAYFLFLFLFLSFPLSLSLFYKLYSCACIFSCGFSVFLAWVVYGVSEQAYLFSLLFSTSIPRSGGGFLLLV